MASSNPTREILWNIDSVINQYVMYGLLAVTLGIAGIGVLRHAELVVSGKQSDSFTPGFFQRLRSLLSWVLLQKGVVRERSIGLAHTLIYVGFLVLLFTTTMVFIHHDLGIHIYQGPFYLAVTLLSDLLGFGVLIGCAMAAHRRYVAKPDFIHNRLADAQMLIVLSLLIVQGFALEGLRIHATNDPWAYYSPIGLLVSKFFWMLSPHATSILHFAMWWLHTITVFIVFALFPYSKYFHILASSANLYFTNHSKPKGALPNPGDIATLVESGEEFSIGLGSIKDYSWKQLLDLEACTSCGRCQDACPAYNSGKPLSPKWMVLDTRNHALALHSSNTLVDSKVPTGMLAIDNQLMKSAMFPSLGLRPGDSGYVYDSGFRAGNEQVDQAPRSLGVSAEHRIAGEVMDENVFWTCTTCMACVEACPVGINHVDLIVGNRRNMALMHGEIPQEAQNTLRALENRANPYGPPSDRANWLEGLEVPILKAGDSVDYLYWVGCVSAYDARKQKIARSLVKLMQTARLSFGILGTLEGCTGDPARRLGEENLFQTLAKSNIETLRSIQFKTLVANCPHCFNTIKNEYPQFGNLSDGKQPEIIHHSVLLKRLLSSGKLSINDDDGENQNYSFHDPCYLGRYNDEYEAPRQTLRAVKSLTILEMDKSKEKGMCCGAGGGHFWMDLKIGERVNVLRTEQAVSTGASHVATACPFCMHMIEDGVKLTNREADVTVKDIAEVLAERI